MRSVPAGSFERLSGVSSLWHAYSLHARGKLRRPAVARFSLDADTHVFALHRALVTGTYRPGPFCQIVIRDPKTRLISVPALRDRIVHQAVVAELDPHFSRSYIDHSFACLPGRGPQRAILCYLAWTRRFDFRLSLDIRPPSGTGLPIGSCLSQWAANLYLDGLDHFIKRVLKIAAYLRYMDDFTLFADDKTRLGQAREAIAGWLAEQRKLVLNPKRMHVRPAAEPSTFLGYRVTRAGLWPAKKMEQRLLINVRNAASRGPGALARTVGSYRALVGFGSTGPSRPSCPASRP